MQWLNRVNQKSADFVVCKKDFSVLVVIELDDSTHTRPSRRKADGDKERAINDAGLPVLRWHVKAMPSIEEIQTSVRPQTAAATTARDESLADIDPVLMPVRPGSSRAL